MWNTRICDILGTEYPIVQSPMGYSITPALVGAVSNAGGMGTLGWDMMIDKPYEDRERDAEHMRSMIKEVRKLTNKPFAINLAPKTGMNPPLPQMRIAIEERVPVGYISTTKPDPAVVEAMHDAGMKVMSIGTTVRHGKAAEEAGVDIFICAGYDAGGHSPGYGDTTIFTELPQVVDALKIPVMGGCGVGDARGFVAALALGAEGICMGTRFAASNECRWGEKAKRALIEADDGATVVWGKTLGHGLGRTLKNKFTDKYLEMEGSGATAQELQAFMSRYVDPAERGLDRRAGAYFEGDIELGTPFMGAIAGLIKDIKPAAEIVSDIVTEAEKVLARLNKERMSSRL